MAQDAQITNHMLNWWVFQLKSTLARNAEVVARWRNRHPEKHRAYVRSSSANHPETKRRINLAWFHRNKEKAHASSKASYHKHREAILARRKASSVKKTRPAPAPRVKKDPRETRRRYLASLSPERKAALNEIKLQNSRKRAAARTPEQLAAHHEYHREYVKRRAKADPAFRMFRTLAPRMSRTLRGLAESVTLIRLVGCSAAELRAHLESTFADWMTWDNYGLGQGKWVVDHIKPVSRFNLNDPEQQKACWHWSNLRALCWRENTTKSAKYTEPQPA